jgi:hypothetical protein
MNTKTLATTIVFASVTVALNPAISGIAIPAPYALLINRKAAVSIAFLNAVVLSTFFPGALPLGSIYNLIALLSTLLGIYIIQKSLKNKNSADSKLNEDSYTKTRFVMFSTALGIILRVVIMTVVNYIVLRYPYPIGFELDELAIIASLPLTGLFNATLTLYTVPLGLFIAKAINKNLKLQ